MVIDQFLESVYVYEGAFFCPYCVIEQLAPLAQIVACYDRDSTSLGEQLRFWAETLNVNLADPSSYDSSIFPVTVPNIGLSMVGNRRVTCADCEWYLFGPMDLHAIAINAYETVLEAWQETAFQTIEADDSMIAGFVAGRKSRSPVVNIDMIERSPVFAKLKRSLDLYADETWAISEPNETIPEGFREPIGSVPVVFYPNVDALERAILVAQITMDKE